MAPDHPARDEILAGVRLEARAQIVAAAKQTAHWYRTHDEPIPKHLVGLLAAVDRLEQAGG